MFRLLDQPYPSEDNLGRQLRKAAAIGLFIGLFLAVFQPFGLSIWETPNKLLKIVGFGLVTFVITAINFIVWQRLFPAQFSDARWTVGREILLITGNILVIAIGNRLYLDWLLSQEQDRGIGWLSMVLFTFFIGLFPVTGLVMMNYITQLRKYSRAAAQLPTHIIHDEVSSTAGAITVSGTTLTLVADNEKDTLSFHPGSLLFIESSDNYCTVVYLKSNPAGPDQPVKPLIRSSLSRLEAQLTASADRAPADQPDPRRTRIVRCHRSYVVNLDRVERVTGNAQGYKLHLLGGQFQVPVARRFNDSLISQLKINLTA